MFAVPSYFYFIKPGETDLHSGGKILAIGMRGLQESLGRGVDKKIHGGGFLPGASVSLVSLRAFRLVLPTQRLECQ